MSIFEEFLDGFLGTVGPARGNLARPNDTFYAHALVSEALSYLRHRVAGGRQLRNSAESFLAGAASYLAYISYLSFKKRGLEIIPDIRWAPGASDNGVALLAQRERAGQAEQYAQDFWLDTVRYLLAPPQPFPVMHGAAVYLRSLSLLPPEYCYMMGAHFLSWPDSAGNWPRGEALGGMKEDFDAGRAFLVDDLLTDVGLEAADPRWRTLSHWVVWPPYGWQQNDAGEYNLMALTDQIAVKRVVPPAEGEVFLRHLLGSQIMHLRLLAARVLLVLGLPPRTPQETLFYFQALNATDFEQILPHLARFRFVVDGHPPAEAVPESFIAACREQLRRTAAAGPVEPWRNDPALRDPLYQRVGGLPPEQREQRREGLRALQQRYPGNWFVEVADAYDQLRSGDPRPAEARLRRAIETCPGDPTAHFSLSGWLLEQGRINETRDLYFNMVARWPWDARAVGNAMWIITKDMVE